MVVLSFFLCPFRVRVEGLLHSVFLLPLVLAFVPLIFVVCTRPGGVSGLGFGGSGIFDTIFPVRSLMVSSVSFAGGVIVAFFSQEN